MKSRSTSTVYYNTWCTFGNGKFKKNENYDHDYYCCAVYIIKIYLFVLPSCLKKWEKK
jgi:hypothetical protein